MIAVIASQIDKASLNIRNNLQELLEFRQNGSFDGNPVLETDAARLYTLSTELIKSENLDSQINAELFIFLSRHKSNQLQKALTAHPIGNWGPAEYGGVTSKLVMAPALMLKKAVQCLSKYASDIGFDSFQEATHHGPYLNTPSIFVEIGSSDIEWSDKNAGYAAAKSVKELLEWEQVNHKVAVGLGGLHNTPAFRRIILESDIALSHICPKYALDSLTRDMLEQAIAKTAEKVELILLDWKGMGSEKQRVVELVKQQDIPFMKTSQV